jgi:hypothetical protein
LRPALSSQRSSISAEGYGDGFNIRWAETRRYQARMAIMTERTTRSSVRFAHPFYLAGIEGNYPPGIYAIEVSEEPIEGMSIVGYRRTQTTIELPSNTAYVSRQVVEIEPADLEAALARDLETGNDKS